MYKLVNGQAQNIIEKFLWKDQNSPGHKCHSSLRTDCTISRAHPALQVCVFCQEIWHASEDSKCSREFTTAKTIGVAAKSGASLFSGLLRNGSAGQVLHQQQDIISHMLCLWTWNSSFCSAVEKYTTTTLTLGTRACSREAKVSAPHQHQPTQEAVAAAGAVC